MNTFNPETHQYFMNGREAPSVTRILKEAGFIEDRWYTEEGRLRGQAVHQAAEFLDQDDLDWESLDSSIKPFIKAYLRFKKETGFVPNLIEERVFHPIYQYAGTLDRTGTFSDGSKVLIDLKTGPVASWAALQTAAYDFCLEESLTRYALQLKDDGRYKLISFKEQNDIKVFLSAAAVVNWKRSQGGAQ